jgi:hypothetical protein
MASPKDPLCEVERSSIIHRAFVPFVSDFFINLKRSLKMSSDLPSIPVQDGSLLPTGKTPRKRGGQPGNSNALCRGAPVGNTNALKHGFYSHTFSQPEIDRLDDDVRGELKDEEAFLRVLLARTAESIKNRTLGNEEYWVALRAVSLAIGRVESLHRSRKRLYENQTALEKVWEELKDIPPEED